MQPWHVLEGAVGYTLPASQSHHFASYALCARLGSGTCVAIAELTCTCLNRGRQRRSTAAGAHQDHIQ